MKYTITYKSKELNKPVELEVEGFVSVKYFLKKTIHFFKNLEWYKIQDSNLNIVKSNNFLKEGSK